MFVRASVAERVRNLARVSAKLGVPDLSRDGRWCSLSQRERVGVREKA